LIWPKRQECERKHTFLLSHNNIIYNYRQIIFRNNLILASLVRLEYLTENSNKVVFIFNKKKKKKKKCSAPLLGPAKFAELYT
jgi:hypothetical protein